MLARRAQRAPASPLVHAVSSRALARWRFAAAVEEFLHAVEEALRLRMRFLAAILGELFQQLALLGGEIDRRFHEDFDVQVAAILAAQVRHALALEAEAAASLRTRRNGDLGAVAFDGRDFHLAAERGFAHRGRGAAVEVGAVALEQLV